MATAPLASLVTTIAIGVVASIVFNRYAQPWFPTRIGAISNRTSALVGVAGAFIGLHIGIVVGLPAWPAMLYIAAIIGAFAVSWAWQYW